MKFKLFMAKFLSVFLVGVFILSTIPFVTNAQSAVKTQSEAVEWLKSQTGATYDFNGANGTQCVEFVKAYVNWLICGNAWTDCWNRVTLDGCNIWKNSLWAELGWEVYYNSDGFIPQPGDIFSAGLGTNGNHTGVVISSDGNTAYIAEANASNKDWNDGDPVRLANKTWQSPESDTTYGATHFIRPIFKSSHTTCTYGSWSTVSAATCTTAGTQQRFCTVCGKVDTETIAAKGHNYSSSYESEHPHKEYKTCSNCNDVIYTGETVTNSDCYTCIESAFIKREIYNNHTYDVYGNINDMKLSTARRSAKNFCLYKGGYLLKIDDADEYSFIHTLFKGKICMIASAYNYENAAYTYNGIVPPQTNATVIPDIFICEYDPNVIEYNANGGKSAPETQIKIFDASIELSNDIPVKEGYAFKGWSTDSSALTATYQPGETYSVNESMTLYAVWEKKPSNSIAVNKMPTKTVYYIGDELETDGLELTVYYDNYTQIVADGYSVSELDSGSSGTKTVVVTYENTTAIFDVIVKEPTITVSENPTCLKEGESLKLTALIDSPDKTVLWTSSNESVATIENGLVYANSAGTAIIQAQITYNQIVYTATYPITVSYIVGSGDCGATSSWEFLSDGTLKITGSGATKNYGTQQSVPWYSYAPQITKIIIDEAITKIGHYSFYCLTNLESVTTNNADLSFGYYVFNGKTTFYSLGAGALEDFANAEGHTLIKPENTETVLKPELIAVSMKSITLKAISGYEYSMDGVTWQDSNVFTNLFADTEYVFYQRIKEGAYKVSAASEEVRFSTLGQIEKPTIEKIEGNTVTLVAKDGYEYSTDGNVWQSSNVFIGLDFDKTITFYQRIANDGENISQTIKCIIPSAPVIKLVGATKVVVKAREGYEYSLDGEYWQQSNVFVMLVPEFDYVVYQRYAANDIYTVTSAETAFITNGQDVNVNPSVYELVSLKRELLFVTEHNNLCYDYNADTEINILDFISLTKHLAGVDSNFPIFNLKAPTGVICLEKGTDYIKIGWNSVDSAVGYNLYMNGKKVNNAPITSTMYTVSGLNGNTEYSFSVSSLNVLTETKQSETIVVKTINPELIVTFKDYDGTILDIQKVLVGNDAVLPSEPTRIGYTFIGWGKDTTNITENTEFVAEYILSTFAITWKTGAGYNISVTRTSSPYGDADSGILNRGDTVYYGDEITIKYTANNGYSITEKGYENITVTKNITDSDIYVIAELLQYTYSVVYKSSNGTNLGSASITNTHGTVETISPKVFSGYNTPASQQVVWDSETKTVTFTYTPEYVATSQLVASGDWYKPTDSNYLKYSVTVEYANRTANSVQVRVHWTNTITNLSYPYDQYCTVIVHDNKIGDYLIANITTWPNINGTTGHNSSVTKSSDWYTISLDSTAQMSLGIASSWASTGGHSGSWVSKILIPAY